MTLLVIYLKLGSFSTRFGSIKVNDQLLFLGNVFAYKKADDFKTCLSHLFLFWYITVIWGIVAIMMITCISVLCFQKCGKMSTTNVEEDE